MRIRPAVAGGLLVVTGFALTATGAAAAGPGPGPRRDTVATVAPCPNGRPVGPNVACPGPAVHHSGSGAGGYAIAISVVVGLVVAGGAFGGVRRRIAHDAANPLPRRPRSPS